MPCEVPCRALCRSVPFHVPMCPAPAPICRAPSTPCPAPARPAAPRAYPSGAREKVCARATTFDPPTAAAAGGRGGGAGKAALVTEPLRKGSLCTGRAFSRKRISHDEVGVKRISALRGTVLSHGKPPTAPPPPPAPRDGQTTWTLSSRTPKPVHTLVKKQPAPRSPSPPAPSGPRSCR